MGGAFGPALFAACVSFLSCLSFLLFYLPVPDRFEVCGLAKASLLTCRVPVCTPVPTGLNVTWIVHLVLAAKVDVQVLEVIAKLPVVEAETPVSDAVFSLLAKVKVLAALLVPAFVLGNFAVAGVKVASEPVPESATTCGLLGALSVTVTEPVRAQAEWA